MSDNTNITPTDKGKQPKRNSSFSLIILFGCLFVLGLFFVPMLSMKLNPSRNNSSITVSFSMPGQSPRVVEMEVTSKLEGMLSRVNGVQEVHSYSGNGHGSVTVKLNKHVVLDIARFDIATVVRQAWPSLPKGVSYPSIYISGGDDDKERSTTFIGYTIHAPISPIEIQEYSNHYIKPALSSIKGIDQINISGATQKIHKLEYDNSQLQTLKLSVGDIRAALNHYLTKEFIGTGVIDDSDSRWIRVAIDNQPAEGLDLSKINIKTNQGNIISLDKIVRSTIEDETPHDYFRVNGLNTIYLSLTAKEGINQLEISRQVKQLMIEIGKTLPPDYQLHLSYDSGVYIKEELQKIYFRSGLTILILLCFVFVTYRNLRYSLMVVCSLAVNMSIAFMLYYMFGLQMHIFSLAGVTISLTLIIDNTIIMSDHIIKRGNKRAFLAVLAATFTTIGSLVIIFFLDESIRFNLLDFAGVIIINMLVSLILALFFVPALIQRLNIKKRVKKPRKRRRFITRYRGKRAIIVFNRIYAKIITLTHGRRRWIIVIVILLFGIPVFLLPNAIGNNNESRSEPTFLEKTYNLTIGSNFYIEKIKPISDVALGGTLRLFVQKVRNGSYDSGERAETSLYVTASLPYGSTLEQMNHLVSRMEDYIGQYSEVRQFEASVQNGQRASITIWFKKKFQRGGFPHTLQSKIIGQALTLGGGSWQVHGVGDGFNNDVKEQAGSNRIKLLGYNYDELYILAERLRDSLQQYRRVKDVIIDSQFSWFKSDYQEYSFEFNKQRLAHLDIRPIQIYESFNPVFAQNSYGGDYFTQSGWRSIRFYSKQAAELDVWGVENMPMQTYDKIFKLSDVAVIAKSQAPQNIAKENQQYRLCLQYDYIGDYSQSYNVMDKQIKAFNDNAPMGYKAESENSRYWWGDQNANNMYMLLLLIVLIIFFMTSILFNSLRQPMVVISIIPISYIGLFLTFYFFDLNFDQGGFAAFVLLSGLAVNSNIYIINEYNNIRKDKTLSPLRAYLKAWNLKIGPIFLTIISTALGFLPFIIGFKEAFWFPLAAGTIGGLLVSIIGSFIFLPMFLGIGKNR